MANMSIDTLQEVNVAIAKLRSELGAILAYDALDYEEREWYGAMARHLIDVEHDVRVEIRYLERQRS